MSCWLRENRKRSVLEEEFELLDTGIFDDDNYFDITITYAKIDQEDICILIEAKNRSKEAAPITVFANSLVSQTMVTRSDPGKAGNPSAEKF